LLAEIVRREAGEAARGWRRIVAGEMNEVYAAQLESGNEVIVRVSRRGNCRFEAERWALRAAAEVGVPVPTVLALATAEDGHGKMEVCVEDLLPGVGMDVIRPPQREALLVQTGELLARLHSIAIEGFGYLN